MKRILRLFGDPVVSIETVYDPSELYYPNTGGSFELAPAESEDEYYEEESDFGFGVT